MVNGIDIGPYNKAVDFALLKQKGIEFVIIKATQGDYRCDATLPKKVDTALNNGLMVGLYHWCDPLSEGKRQAEYFLKKVEKLTYHFAAVDVEQEWADWKEWPDKITKLIEPLKISDRAEETTRTIAGGLGRNPLVYTRATFVHDYARPMVTWIKEFPLWLAHWAYRSGRVICSWEDWQEKHQPKIKGPDLPQGCKDWLFWQVSGDKFVLPGLYGSTVELDLFNGSLDDLRRWCGVPVMEPTIEDLLSKLEAETDKYLLHAENFGKAIKEYAAGIRRAGK